MNDALNLLNRLGVTKKGTPWAEFQKDGHNFRKTVSCHTTCNYCNYGGSISSYEYYVGNNKATADFCPRCGACIAESWGGHQGKSYMDFNY